MIDSYCDYLFSPEVSGNLKLNKDKEPLYVLRGQTRNNFSNVYYEYARAKLRHVDALPKDFLGALKARNYFETLQVFINRKPREAMSFEERMRSEQQDLELGYLWTASIVETVLKRMELKHKGFLLLKDEQVPAELHIEKKKARRKLISEISRAIWQKHKNWKKVESAFEGLRSSFLSMIKKLDIDATLKSQWMERMLSVQLVLPGSLQEISDDECSTTKSNAYYYTHHNVITICAGDFNGEDMFETLAHEMAHALDIDRSLYLQQRKSEIGNSLAVLRNASCKPEVFSCEDWSLFKKYFEHDLEYLKNYTPELKEFQQCLKTRTQTRPIKKSDLEKLATISANNAIADLAQKDIFLRITKQSLPLLNGQMKKNPHYLNPCSYSLWSLGEEPIDDPLYALIFFTSEYRCSNGTSAERLKTAIDKARTMHQQIVHQVLSMEGEFSSHKIMETQGYASSPAERFADVLGSYALSEYLDSIPSINDRRNVFLASSSWQCRRPSTSTAYPEESAAQRLYMTDSYLSEEERRMEFLSEPMRKVLACDLDFKFRSCELPFL